MARAGSGTGRGKNTRRAATARKTKPRKKRKVAVSRKISQSPLAAGRQMLGLAWERTERDFGNIPSRFVRSWIDAAAVIAGR